MYYLNFLSQKLNENGKCVTKDDCREGGKENISGMCCNPNERIHEGLCVDICPEGQIHDSTGLCCPHGRFTDDLTPGVYRV